MFMNLVHAFLVAYWLAMDFHFEHPDHGTWVKKVERLRRAVCGGQRAASSSGKTIGRQFESCLHP